MATTAQFVEFVAEQIAGAGDITTKMMFGEYGVYCNGKFFGMCNDNQFFLKPTEACRALLREVVEAAPYEGAKPAFLITELEDSDYLVSLVTATCSELPEPKPKQPREKKAKKTE